MTYIALRPCSFGGEKFYVGDIVPTALIRPEMVKRLITAGVITEVREPPVPVESEPEPEHGGLEPKLESESEPKAKRARNKKSGEG